MYQNSFRMPRRCILGELGEVHRMLGRGSDKLRLCGTPALFVSFEGGGRRNDNQPCTRFGSGGGITEPIQRLGERGGANPVHFRAEAERRTGRMDVGIDQARDDGASLEIDRPRRATRQFSNVLVTAERKDPAVAYRTE